MGSEIASCLLLLIEGSQHTRGFSNQLVFLCYHCLYLQVEVAKQQPFVFSTAQTVIIWSKIFFLKKTRVQNKPNILFLCFFKKSITGPHFAHTMFSFPKPIVLRQYMICTRAILPANCMFHIVGNYVIFELTVMV